MRDGREKQLDVERLHIPQTHIPQHWENMVLQVGEQRGVAVGPELGLLVDTHPGIGIGAKDGVIGDIDPRPYLIAGLCNLLRSFLLRSSADINLLSIWQRKQRVRWDQVQPGGRLRRVRRSPHRSVPVVRQGPL